MSAQAKQETEKDYSTAYRMRKSAFHTLVKCSHAIFGEGVTHRSSFAKGVHGAVFSVLRAMDSSRRKQAAFEKANPDAPWLVPDAIDRLLEIITPDMRYLEWGTGRSTIWFGKRVSSVVSIEHDDTWKEIVLADIEKNGLSEKVEYHLVPGDAQDPDVVDAPYCSKIQEYPDASFDMILVDGMNRNGCIVNALPKLKPTGYLVVDNAERLDMAEALAAVPAKHWEKYTNGIWETHILHGFE